MFLVDLHYVNSRYNSNNIISNLLMTNITDKIVTLIIKS